jgi:hypothetical protein
LANLGKHTRHQGLGSQFEEAFRIFAQRSGDFGDPRKTLQPLIEVQPLVVERLRKLLQLPNFRLGTLVNLWPVVFQKFGRNRFRPAKLLVAPVGVVIARQLHFPASPRTEVRNITFLSL